MKAYAYIFIPFLKKKQQLISILPFKIFVIVNTDIDEMMKSAVNIGNIQPKVTNTDIPFEFELEFELEILGLTRRAPSRSSKSNSAGTPS